MSTTWTSEANHESKLADFAAELAKEEPSKGSFSEDYAAACAAHEIVPCPFISVSGSGARVCRVANTIVDLPSWRAALLAIALEGSTVAELHMHGCELSRQHLADLCACLEKKGHFAVCKLDYLTISVPAGDAAEEGKGEEAAAGSTSAFLPVLAGKAHVEYLSLKGNNLGPLCSSADFKTALSENLSLKALSLADNKLDDTAVAAVLSAAKLSPCVTELSLAQNACEGECLSALQGLLTGSEVSPEDDASFKNIAKAVGDKNKAIKDTNKIRKKKGLPDLHELTAPAERIEAGFMSNRTIKVIDMSLCPLSATHYKAFMSSVSNVENHKAVAHELSATVIVRGSGEAAEQEKLRVVVAGAEAGTEGEVSPLLMGLQILV
jgi:hypothetical protein